MPQKKDDLPEIRQELVRLLEDDEWMLTRAAELSGREVLGRKLQYPTQCDIIRFVLSALKTDFPIHEVALGERPGSLGAGYVMNNADGEGLYVKLNNSG